MTDQNTDQPAATPALPAPASQAPKPTRQRQWLGLASVVLSLGALGYTFYLQHTVAQLADAPRTYVAQTDWQTHNAQHAQQLTALQQQLNTAQGALNQLQQNDISRDIVAKLDQELQAIQTTVAAVQAQQQQLSQQHPLEARWQLVSVRHLLSIADQALRLQQNIDTAIAALEIAEAQLRNTGYAAWLPLRDRITQDLQSLRAVHTPDLADMAQQLERIATLAQQLPNNSAPTQWPIATPTTPSSISTDTTWQDKLAGLWRQITHSLRGIVEFRRDTTHTQPYQAPEQHALMQQTIMLRLQLAKIALARRDKTLYQNTILDTETWLSATNPASNHEQQQLLTDLRTLKAIDIAPPLPTLAGSWQALQTAEQTALHETTP
jgi:uroporphyrin-III C-methyltransferase